MFGSKRLTTDSKIRTTDTLDFIEEINKKNVKTVKNNKTLETHYVQIKKRINSLDKDINLYELSSGILYRINLQEVTESCSYFFNEEDFLETMNSLSRNDYHKLGYNGFKVTRKKSHNYLGYEQKDYIFIEKGFITGSLGVRDYIFDEYDLRIKQIIEPVQIKSVQEISQKRLNRIILKNKHDRRANRSMIPPYAVKIMGFLDWIFLH